MNGNPDEMMQEFIGILKKSAESANSLQEEQMAQHQKDLLEPKKKYYKIEGFFSAIQMQKLAEFLKDEIFNE
ncbi:MAG: hypothetical protein COA77_02525 [Thaumarchaeota archaeon]|nr:MAG: hypothetical protein COA77_02525 [Nitrososphaerota archaeon]